MVARKQKERSKKERGEGKVHSYFIMSGNRSPIGFLLVLEQGFSTLDH